ncbi:hypothetical protein EDD18DRAFT_1343182 [Armillaria luteobubalina]|uniref:Uncharacterized protein n=1 Tax=Armillaria luteobubalina TaxID=153913 RepID=A0AA39U338_9AGAR|nr:hypothetical protein EDD18DRAFT_1343182 [Armillaria luteobubalina]
MSQKYKILLESEAMARAVERGSILGESELRRNRASFLHLAFCVLIIGQNLYCHDDGRSVLPIPETFPYSFHWQQAIYADDHAGPSTTAKDPGDHSLLGPLDLSSNALRSLTLPFSIGQSNHPRPPNLCQSQRKQSAELYCRERV